jgi:hypothetical protein
MVPVNTSLPSSIAAHLVAFRRYLLTAAQRPRTWAFHALRAVIVARTPEVTDDRQQLDYLTGLPEQASEPYPSHTLQKVRDATLSAVTEQHIRDAHRGPVAA